MIAENFSRFKEIKLRSVDAKFTRNIFAAEVDVSIFLTVTMIRVLPIHPITRVILGQTTIINTKHMSYNIPIDKTRY